MIVVNGIQYKAADLASLVNDRLHFEDFLRSVTGLNDRKNAAETLVEIAEMIHESNEQESLVLYQTALKWQPSSEKVREFVYRYLEMTDDPMSDFLLHFNVQKHAEEFLHLLQPNLDGLSKVIVLAHFLTFSHKIPNNQVTILWIKERISMYPSNAKAKQLFEIFLGTLA
jgi:hypothetical protein